MESVHALSRRRRDEARLRNPSPRRQVPHHVFRYLSLTGFNAALVARNYFGTDRPTFFPPLRRDPRDETTRGDHTGDLSDAINAFPYAKRDALFSPCPPVVIASARDAAPSRRGPGPLTLASRRVLEDAQRRWRVYRPYASPLSLPSASSNHRTKEGTEGGGQRVTPITRSVAGGKRRGRERDGERGRMRRKGAFTLSRMNLSGDGPDVYYSRYAVTLRITIFRGASRLVLAIRESLAR